MGRGRRLQLVCWIACYLLSVEKDHDCPTLLENPLGARVPDIPRSNLVELFACSSP